MYGKAIRNGYEVRRLYHEAFSMWNLPSHPYFPVVDRKLSETGPYATSNGVMGHMQVMSLLRMEEYFLNRFGAIPPTSTRMVTANIGMCDTMV